MALREKEYGTLLLFEAYIFVKTYNYYRVFLSCMERKEISPHGSLNII